MAEALSHSDRLRIEVSSVEVQSLKTMGTIPGVAILAASGGNGSGAGEISCLESVSESGNLRISWTAPGDDEGEAIEIPTDGVYLLESEDTSKWVRVQVWTDYLIQGQSAAVTLADWVNNAIGSDNVTADEAESGDYEVITLTVVNDSRLDTSNVRAWIA